MPSSRRQRRKYRVVALGGTFDHFHVGHRALVDEGVRRGELALIGVVSNRLARKLGKGADYDYKRRKASVVSYLKKTHPGSNWRVFPLYEPYGPFGTDASVEAVVVTPESLGRAEVGNEARIKKGLRRVDILMVPLVLAEDGRRVSSTRIRRGEIDTEGRLEGRRRGGIQANRRPGERYLKGSHRSRMPAG